MHYAYAPTIPLPVQIKAHKRKMWVVDGLLNCMTTCTGVLFLISGLQSPLATVLRVCAGQHASAQNVREEHCCRRFTVPLKRLYCVTRAGRLRGCNVPPRRPCPARANKQIPSQRSPAVAADVIHSRSCTRREIVWTLLYTASEFDFESHL
jgi:hypothetical protein